MRRSWAGSMEGIIYQGRTSLIKYWYLVGMGGLMIASGIQLINSPSPGAEGLGAFFVLPGLILVGFAYLSVTATSYTVTSRQVIQRKGLFSPRTSAVAVSEIRNVEVDQSSIERLFGIGNVAVSKAGGPGREVVFTGIRNPHEVAELIPGRRTKVAQRGRGLRLAKR